MPWFRAFIASNSKGNKNITITNSDADIISSGYLNKCNKYSNYNSYNNFNNYNNYSDIICECRSDRVWRPC